MMRLGGLAALPLTALVQPAIWTRLSVFYKGDDAFTLGISQRIGLGLISFVMIALLFVVFARISQKLAAVLSSTAPRLGCDIALRVLGFAALITCAPQIYYAYYRLIIPGLPAQWVIRWPDMSTWATLLTFAPDGRLAEHLISATLWGLIVAAIWWNGPKGRIRQIMLTAIVLAAPTLIRFAA